MLTRYTYSTSIVKLNTQIRPKGYLKGFMKENFTLNLHYCIFCHKFMYIYINKPIKIVVLSTK